MKIRRILATVLALAMVLSLMTSAFATDTFTDVADSAWYDEAVVYCFDNNIMHGVAAGVFAPEGIVTRETVVQTFYNMEGQPDVSDVIPFSDVEPDFWSTAAIKWAAEVGIAGGYPNGTFGGGKAVTRQELTVFMSRYAKLKGLDTDSDASLERFPDSNTVGPWAMKEMQWAVAAGLVNGVGTAEGTDLLLPVGTATRAQLAAILMRLHKQLPTETTYTFAVLSTTDMHGRATINDVAQQREDPNSMERVATIVKAQREEYGDNLLLVDDGDLIQGTLVAQYAINSKPEVLNPMIQTLAEIGYDVYEMGNHEFNFAPTQRNTQVAFAEENGIAVLGGNIVLKEDGKNVHGEDVKAGEPYYDPFFVKELDAGNGRTVRVAVIGLGNAANETWDVATNYPNLQFTSLDNPKGLLENEINKWSSYIVENDLADIIVVSAHSGKGTDDGVASEDFLLESQAVSGAKASNNVDLLIYGHDHTANVETVTNADGKEIYIVNGGGTAVTKNEFNVTFDADGKVKDFTVTAELLPLNEVESDTALGEIMQPWYDDTYAWASAPLATFDNGWTAVKAQAEGKKNEDMILNQTALMDFVHKAQIWCSWLSYEDQSVEGATVSIASPVFGKDSDGNLSFVPEDGDTISMLELSKLYRYSNNLLCAIDMTGPQLLAWMSRVADMYAIKDGQPAMADGVSIYGLDTFYGVDYTFDLTKPAGERVVTATYNGTELAEYEGKIRVTLNSYRLSGGYGFYEATGLTEADCAWTAYQFLGEDRAPVPNMLGEYVAHMGVVSPDDAVSHGTASAWNLVVNH